VYWTGKLIPDYNFDKRSTASPAHHHYSSLGHFVTVCHTSTQHHHTIVTIINPLDPHRPSEYILIFTPPSSSFKLTWLRSIQLLEIGKRPFDSRASFVRGNGFTFPDGAAKQDDGTPRFNYLETVH
jgi:hypothetical protein